MPDPGKKRRRSLDQLLADTPALAVVIDTCEQRVQRPPERQAADALYSGKKKTHMLKSQVAVEDTGRIVAVGDSIAGPTSDIMLLKQSGLLDRLPAGMGGIGDLASLGIDKLHPSGLGPHQAARRGAEIVPLRILSTIGHARSGALWSSIVLGGCAAINRLRKRIGIIVPTIGRGCERWLG